MFSFLAVLGLYCYMWSFCICSEQGLLLAAVHGLLIAVVSLVGSMGSRHVAFSCLASVGVAGVHKSKGSEVVVHGIDPRSPAVAGRCLTPRSPGKPQCVWFFKKPSNCLSK